MGSARMRKLFAASAASARRAAPAQSDCRLGSPMGMEARLFCIALRYRDSPTVTVLDNNPITVQNCGQEDIGSMFSWWPTRSRVRIEKLDAAYLRRMCEVLENCTEPRHQDHVSEGTPPEPSPPLAVEARAGSPTG